MGWERNRKREKEGKIMEESFNTLSFWYKLSSNPTQFIFHIVLHSSVPWIYVLFFYFPLSFPFSRARLSTILSILEQLTLLIRLSGLFLFFLSTNLFATNLISLLLLNVECLKTLFLFIVDFRAPHYSVSEKHIFLWSFL